MYDTVITDNLLSYWTMNESSGDRLDSVGDVDLNDTNTVPSVAGQINNAANFTEGNNEYLVATTASELNVSGNTDFSIAGWVRLNSKANPRSVIAKWNADSGDPNRQYALIYNNGTDRFEFLVSSDGTAFSTVQANTFGSPSTATWYFFYVEHDATADTIRISINNGTIDSAAHSTGVFSSSAILRIGALQGGSGEDAFQMTGDIDAVGFWQKVLNDEERSILYKNGAGREFPFFLDGPTSTPALLGGYLKAIDPPPVSGLLGGFILGGVTLGPFALGGYLFSKPEFNNVGQLGGYLLSEGSLFVNGFLGGFLLASDIKEIGPFYLGGLASGLFAPTNAILGGYCIGQPSGNEFVECRARTLVKVRSEDVVDQGLNLDAQIMLKQINSSNFNALFTWIATHSSDFMAKFKVEKYTEVPTVQILSVTPQSGVLGPDGCRKVTVIASGTLGSESKEWINAQIDFGEPLKSFSPRVFTTNMSVSGFNTPPPWVSTHDYCSSGKYIITARGQDNLGLVGMDSYNLNLASGLPDTDFPKLSITANPRAGFVPDALFVQFALESSGLPSPPHSLAISNSTKIKTSSDRRIIWSFGNKSISQFVSPNSYYQTPGNYIAVLRYLYIHPSGGNMMWVSDSLNIGFNI